MTIIKCDGVFFYCSDQVDGALQSLLNENSMDIASRFNDMFRPVDQTSALEQNLSLKAVASEASDCGFGSNLWTLNAFGFDQQLHCYLVLTCNNRICFKQVVQITVARESNSMQLLFLNLQSNEL